MPQHLDLPFARVDGITLCLDLFLPEGVTRPPLVLFIHGGAWQSGTRKNAKMEWLVERGYALASMDHRTSAQARFPAQIFDCKGAVRWLRAHAERYGYDAARLGVAGASSGGHLAALLGVTASVAELEGDVGGNLEQSSRVRAVVDYYGPTDFILRSRTQPDKTEPPESRVYKLLGGPVHGNEALARRASPAWHVGPDAAPLLVIHGTEDATVLPDQSERLIAAYRALKLDATLHVVPGAGHGGPHYAQPEHRRPVEEFLGRQLRGDAGVKR
jgi:acetyl esterase/lipase